MAQGMGCRSALRFRAAGFGAQKQNALEYRNAPALRRALRARAQHRLQAVQTAKVVSVNQQRRWQAVWRTLKAVFQSRVALPAPPESRVQEATPEPIARAQRPHPNALGVQEHHARAIH